MASQTQNLSSVVKVNKNDKKLVKIAKFKWTDKMITDLINCLHKYKVEMEFLNKDTAFLSIISKNPITSNFFVHAVHHNNSLHLKKQSYKQTNSVVITFIFSAFLVCLHAAILIQMFLPSQPVLEKTCWLASFFPYKPGSSEVSQLGISTHPGSTVSYNQPLSILV